MKGIDQHVIVYGHDWAVRASGSHKPTIIVRTQEQAIKIAKEIAEKQQSELVIHGQDGREKRRYSFADTAPVS